MVVIMMMPIHGSVIVRVAMRVIVIMRMVVIMVVMMILDVMMVMIMVVIMLMPGKRVHVMRMRMSGFLCPQPLQAFEE